MQKFDVLQTSAEVRAVSVRFSAQRRRRDIQQRRERLVLPDAGVLLWLLPGAVIGALLALWPAIQRRRNNLSVILLRLSLFTSLLNIAAAALR